MREKILTVKTVASSLAPFFTAASSIFDDKTSGFIRLSSSRISAISPPVVTSVMPSDNNTATSFSNNTRRVTKGCTFSPSQAATKCFHIPTNPQKKPALKKSGNYRTA